MLIVIFSDKNLMNMAEALISSLSYKLSERVKLVYYTVGFDYDTSGHKHLLTKRIEFDDTVDSFWDYKPRICLDAINSFDETDYFFSDIDVLFSRKVDFSSMSYATNYPIASFGPVEFPCIWVSHPNECCVYTEGELAKFLGVEGRTMRYVWACFFYFNRNCKNFFQDVISLLENPDLQKKDGSVSCFLPFRDETAMNVLLWKYGAVENFGFGFLNSHKLENILYTEFNHLLNYSFGPQHLDCNGYDWQFVHDSSKILAYHGIKNIEIYEGISNYFALCAGKR